MYDGNGFGCATIASEFVSARDAAAVLNLNYALKGWLLCGETSVLYGPSNVGKSALVVHLGQAVSSGHAAFGARVSKGMIVHVAAEAPNSIIERAQIYTHDADAAEYMVKTRGIDLTDSQQVAAFIASVQNLKKRSKTPVKLVIFDTLARSIGDVDENAAGPMTRVADAAQRIARELDAHVMLVHHTGKDADRGGRGSSALRSAVDTELSLAPQNDGTVLLRQEKQRTMEKSPPVQFSLASVVLGLDADGDKRTTVQVRELSGTVAPPEKRKNTQGASLEAAITTLLYLRHKSSNTQTFKPAELLVHIPEQLFTSALRESRIKAVARVLQNLANLKEPIVQKVGTGWEISWPANCPAPA